MAISFRVLILIAGLLGSGQVRAALSPLAVSIAPGIQFPPADFTVTGLRLSVLVGQHRDVYGFDFGLIGNMTQQTFSGLAVSGLFNYTGGTTNVIGLQAAALLNYNTNKTSILGIQLAAVNSNTASSKLIGLQLALSNLSPFTRVYGMQLGLYNKAQDVYGFQIGLVNYAGSLHGLQIGLVNFNTSGLFFVSPILNFGF
jgi:hypothetical protein